MIRQGKTLGTIEKPNVFSCLTIIALKFSTALPKIPTNNARLQAAVYNPGPQGIYSREAELSQTPQCKPSPLRNIREIVAVITSPLQEVFAYERRRLLIIPYLGFPNFSLFAFPCADISGTPTSNNLTHRMI